MQSLLWRITNAFGLSLMRWISHVKWKDTELKSPRGSPPPSGPVLWLMSVSKTKRKACLSWGDRLMNKWDLSADSSLEVKHGVQSNISRFQPCYQDAGIGPGKEQDEKTGNKIKEKENQHEPIDQEMDDTLPMHLCKTYLCMLLTLCPLWTRLGSQSRNPSFQAWHHTAQLHLTVVGCK